MENKRNIYKDDKLALDMIKRGQKVTHNLYLSHSQNYQTKDLSNTCYFIVKTI